MIRVFPVWMSLLLVLAISAWAGPADSDRALDLDLQSTSEGRFLLERYLESKSWRTFGRGGVRSYATRTWTSEAERAERAAREVLPRIASALDLLPESVLPVWIIVSPGGGGFAREAPSWSAAIAQPKRHLIVLSGPAMRRTRMSLEETVAHEVAHLAFGVRLGEIGWAPRWLVEGIAMHLSGYHRLSDRLATLGRGPVHLAELREVFPHHPQRARLAYIESEAAVRRLLGLGPLAPFLDRLAAGEEFEDAFFASYGLSEREFADEVHAEVSRRARWISVLGGSASLFGVMTLLLVAGAVRQRLRNRRRMREWESAEAGLEAVREADPDPEAPPGEPKPR